MSLDNRSRNAVVKYIGIVHDGLVIDKDYHGFIVWKDNDDEIHFVKHYFTLMKQDDDDIEITNFNSHLRKEFEKAIVNFMFDKPDYSNHTLMCDIANVIIKASTVDRAIIRYEHNASGGDPNVE